MDSGAHPLHNTMLDQRALAVQGSDRFLGVVIHARASVIIVTSGRSSVRKSTKHLLNEALLACNRWFRWLGTLGDTKVCLR